MSSARSNRKLVLELRELPEDIDTVVLGGTDTHGVMRGKRVPREQLERLLADGMPMCDVFWVLHVDESDLVPRPQDHKGFFPTETAGYPDILAQADVGTLRVVPWQDRTAILLCDFVTLQHEPVTIDPRTVLKGVIDRAASMRLHAYCALELEFYVLRETSGSLLEKRPSELQPLSARPSTYGVVRSSEQEPVGHLIRESMLRFGLPIEACNPETGPGQFEITLEYRDAIQAADHAFLFKTGVKEVIGQQDLMATFMAKPRSDWAGNSCHVHLSLRDDNDRAVFYDGSSPNGLSSTMSAFVAGSLSTMAEMSALFAPTVNSYRRYTPYSWAATTATWGIDNRSTGIRVICEGENGTRIEHRRCGGDVNPYIATAAVLAGGLHGIEQKLSAPEPFEGDVYAAAPGTVEELPRSLDEATELLAASEVARDWLGADFVSHYVEMKRAEVEAQRRAVTDWEIARYLEAL